MSSAKREIQINGRNNGTGCAGVPPFDVVANYPKGPSPFRQLLNKLELPGLTLTEAVHAPCTVIPPHGHASASICLTLAGEAIEFNGGVGESTRPGSLILRSPGLVHSDRYGATAHRAFMIEIDSKWLETCHQLSRVFEGYKHFHGGLLPSLAFRIYRESRIKDSVAPVVVEGLMLEMLGMASRSLARPPVRLPKWLMQARDLLHGNFNDSLNLVQIAETVGVHPTHLARTFKKHYQTTVGEYIRRLRLDWATKQLSETEESLTEIALAAGFYDQSHFSHLFKQHTGFTPAEFRASSRGTD